MMSVFSTDERERLRSPVFGNFRKTRRDLDVIGAAHLASRRYGSIEMMPQRIA